ncbi:glycosyltransferase [Planomicrobium okeanokoites]|uniref:glycosyltransferase n=1 Tax=Planomicrobium okeanokoites TaxID=244 RepID=UPI000A03D5A1|nr:glycosyltransferase [Planomicrobium okeanokoites]
MKVLLLGEFSGFFNNLRDGLTELGHEVDMSSSGDGWKMVAKGNIKLFSNHKNVYLRKFLSLYYQLKNLHKLKGYDVVQIVSPDIFGNIRFGYNKWILTKIAKNNKKIILSNAGDHYYNYKVTLDKLKYGYYKEIATETNRFNNKYYKKNNQEILEVVDGIIPVMYTYAEAYRPCDKLLRTIPLPINLSKVEWTKQKIKNKKMIFFHGLNREGSKGTKYISEAMEKLKENYPDEVEIIIDGKMPLEKYLEILKVTNVVIDQALSYEYGMNALYSMAMGKVVLSGNEIECQREFDRYDIPVINIQPSVEDIYHKLEKLVKEREKIYDIGLKSRNFVSNFHDHVKVAQMYIDTWNNVEVGKNRG